MKTNNKTISLHAIFQAVIILPHNNLNHVVAFCRCP